MQISHAWNDPALEAVWTLTLGTVDCVTKVIDVTDNGDPVDVVSEIYSLSASDGAVMIGTDVYLPTFGGVVRYELIGSVSAPVWRADQDSYQAAETDDGKGDIVPTENIDVGSFGDPTSIDYLFMPCQPSGFDMYQIDSGEPQTPDRFSFDSELLPEGWGANPLTYSFDPAFLDLEPLEETEGKFVLIELTLIEQGQDGDTPQEAALAAIEWDSEFSVWFHVATSDVYEFPSPCESTALATTVTLAEVPGSPTKHFAFVGSADGVFSVDLNDLQGSPPTMTIVDEVHPGSGTSDCSHMHAVAVSGDRLFSWVNIGNGVGNVYVYSWNTGTGAIIEPHLQIFDVPSPYENSGSVRARFDPTDSNGEGDVYFAAAPYLLQFHNPGNGQGDITFTGQWRGDYDGALQDCRVYTLPGSGSVRGILTVKYRQSFAFIRTEPE